MAHLPHECKDNFLKIETRYLRYIWTLYQYARIGRRRGRRPPEWLSILPPSAISAVFSDKCTHLLYKIAVDFFRACFYTDCNIIP